MEGTNKLYKDNETNKFTWLGEGPVGEMLFTFDGQKFYNLFSDYPWKLSDEEKAIFDKEYPFWADFFKDRQ